MDSKDLISRIEGELGSTAGRDTAAPLHPPPRVADHELVRRIGAGSYGEVWLARSVIGQWRAVKVVARDRFSSDRPYDREFRGVIQFEPISRSHSGLVHVLHVGRDDLVEAFYYVMELADGVRSQGPEVRNQNESQSEAARATESPDSRVLVPDSYSPRTLRSDLKARGRLPVAEAVALGVELAGALGHIHRHGLVHRDVKPSNVIFVQGQPKLADLGLVATTSEARSFVGTEGFIPPEGPGTVKADLFALGRLLYEAVTGKDRCEFPELPPDLDSWPNREEFLEFNEVVTRLCAPEPSRRYGNAAEVAGDLNLILAGRSVRRANGIERRLQQARRITLMTLIGLAIAAGVVWLQQSRQHEAETRAAHEKSLRERAVTVERESRQLLYAALLEQARATVRGGEMGQKFKALDAVQRAATITNTTELRREALAALALPDLHRQRQLPFGAEYTGREVDPTFTRIALCRGRGPVEVRAIPDLALLATLPPSTNLNCYGILWSADGRFLIVKRDNDSRGYEADLEVWEMSDPPRRKLVVHDARFNAWSFHPSRPELLTAVGAGTIVRWELERGTELERQSVEVTIEALRHSPDGSSVAAAYPRDDGWGVSIHPTGKTNTQASHVFTSRISAIQWHPRGRWLAITDFSGAVHLMDPVSGAVRLLGRHRAESVAATFDSRGDYLITAGWERTFVCWDVRSMERAFAIELDSYVARFQANGSGLAVMTGGAVELHTFERPEVVRELAVKSSSRLHHAAFSPDGRLLAVSSAGGLNVWDVTGGAAGATDEAAAEIRPFWSGDGTELFGSNSRAGAHRWRVRTATAPDGTPSLERLPLRRPAGNESLCAASNLVAWTGTRGTQFTSPGSDPAEAGPWIRTARGISGLSPDGRWLGIYGSGTRVLYVYRVPDLAHVAAVTNRSRISGFTFSPSGRELAVVSRGHLEIRSTATWEHLREMTNMVGSSYVGTLYQPDERALWLVSSQGAAGLHDGSTFQALLPLPAGTVPMALSADGRHLAVSVDSRRLQIWDLASVRTHLRKLGLDWADSRP